VTFFGVDKEAILEDLLQGGPGEALDLIEYILKGFKDPDLNGECIGVALRELSDDEDQPPDVE